jgi:hypothetical protein
MHRWRLKERKINKRRKKKMRHMKLGKENVENKVQRKKDEIK